MAAPLYVHPLVVMTIADHHTRENAGKKQPSVVMGAMVGTKDEVHATLPIKYKSNLQFEKEHLAEDLSLYRELNPEQTILGWYCTHPGLKTDLITKIMVQFQQWTKTPLYFALNPQIKPDARQVPMTAVQFNGKTLSTRAWTLKSDQSEIAAVDFAVQESDRLQAERLGQSVTTAKYSQLTHAVKAMMKRVELLQTYLADIQKGAISPDQEILREIKTLCNMLPIMDKSDFLAQYTEEQKNGNVLVLTSELTSASQNLCRVMDSYAPLMEGPNSVRGMGGGEPMMGMGMMGSLAGIAHGFL